MNAEDLRGYALRRWDLIEAAKAAFWVEEKDRLGVAGALGIADELRRCVLVLRPGRTDDLERAADLDAHEGLSRMLRLVGSNRAD